jgi:hypothetical protein
MIGVRYSPPCFYVTEYDRLLPWQSCLRYDEPRWYSHTPRCNCTITMIIIIAIMWMWCGWLDETKQKWPAVLSEGILNKIKKTEWIISLAASLNVDNFLKKVPFVICMQNPIHTVVRKEMTVDKETTDVNKKFRCFKFTYIIVAWTTIRCTVRQLIPLLEQPAGKQHDDELEWWEISLCSEPFSFKFLIVTLLN